MGRRIEPRERGPAQVRLADVVTLVRRTTVDVPPKPLATLRAIVIDPDLIDEVAIAANGRLALVRRAGWPGRIVYPRSGERSRSVARDRPGNALVLAKGRSDVRLAMRASRSRFRDRLSRRRCDVPGVRPDSACAVRRCAPALDDEYRARASSIHHRHLRSAAGSRTYKLFIPSRSQEEPLPLLVILHGCTQSPDDFAAGTRMKFLAEERNCFVVYSGAAQRSQSVKNAGTRFERATSSGTAASLR